MHFLHEGTLVHHVARAVPKLDRITHGHRLGPPNKPIRSHTGKIRKATELECLHVAIRHLQQLCMPLGRVAVEEEPPDDAAPVVDPGEAVVPVELLPAVLLPVELLPDADEPGARCLTELVAASQH